MITKDTITERKDVLERDINSVRERLAGYERSKQEDTALLNALTGALQQCDNFLKELDNEELDDEEPEMVSDDGNDGG